MLSSCPFEDVPAADKGVAEARRLGHQPVAAAIDFGNRIGSQAAAANVKAYARRSRPRNSCGRPS